MVVLGKNGLLGQWNRTESPEIGPHKYSQLLFDTGTKAVQRSKDNLLYK